ncbi:AMP-dependent synthetase/ligase, partial [Thermodesulfobacteriota bacterium]
MFNPQKIYELCRTSVISSGYPSDHFQQCVLTARDTLPKILKDKFQRFPQEVCMRQKDFGIWNEYTWAEVYENIKYMALGLKKLGLERGDKVGVIGDNEPVWYWAEMAIQSMGAACVGLFLDAMPLDLEYIINNSDTVLVFAKDQEQVDKFLEIKDKIPGVKRIIYWDDKGMVGYRENPWLMDLKELEESGREYEKQYPTFFDESVEQGKQNEMASLCYTSGTTSLPKGATLSHEYLIKASIRCAAVVVPQAEDEFLSYMSPAWITGQEKIATWVLFRNRANFPEKPETLMENMREIGPQVILFGPMQWQGILSKVQMKIYDTGPIRKIIYRLCLPVGYRAAEYLGKNRQKPPIFWRFLYLIANGLCFRNIRDNEGLGRIRDGLTGGSALGPDVIRWFRALGVNIKDGYGMTEIYPVAMHRRMIKPGTVGPPYPGVEVKIGEDDEIFIRSDVMFDGYYKKPEATKEMIAGGWVKSGDCGTIDDEGHLIIYDRIKEMLHLKGGGTYSPSYVQNRLKFSPYIKETMVVGGKEREFVFAIITIDFDNVGKWAEKKRISYTTFVDLSQKNVVYDLIEEDVARVNQTLPKKAR